MAELVADPALVAACGLYCGACKKHLSGHCPGCADNETATWCKVRTCCREKGIANCGACAEHPDPKTCRTYDNFVARMVGFLLRSDRAACARRIRELGTDAFAREMAAKRAMTIRR